ncbi:MAG: class I SAM-dependent methyltransferase [Hyphomonadaceae bacterium]|nr:class I SAM-dependent methyltransferase [Clostridia bacterium]
MWLADNWIDYEVLDTGDGEKLERWGDIILRRPDPQVIWQKSNDKLWQNAHGHYHRSQTGGGQWEMLKKMPERWTINFQSLAFHIKPMGFKHTGLFPEQATNWSWMMDKIQNANRPIKVLNLFAYTGGATVAAAQAGAEVCHVDASKGMVAWAKENMALSNLSSSPVRFIVDDVIKFVQRESRRGKKYDGIIMDPPSYGRGPNGEIWKIEDELMPLLNSCREILSDNPLFFILNSYTTGLAPTVLRNVLNVTLQKTFGGQSLSDEIGLPITKSKLLLPCGATGRWENS